MANQRTGSRRPRSGRQRRVTNAFKGTIAFRDGSIDEFQRELVKVIRRLDRRIQRAVGTLNTSGGNFKKTSRAIGEASKIQRQMEEALVASGYHREVRTFLGTATPLRTQMEAAYARLGLPVGFNTVDIEAFRATLAADYTTFANIGRRGTDLIRTDFISAVTGEANVNEFMSRTQAYLYGKEGMGLLDASGSPMFRHAATLADTSMTQLHRKQMADLGEKAGVERWQYRGPFDKSTRIFCRHLWQKVYTREEIDDLDNGMVPDVFVSGGGWNCRHTWLPYLEDPKAPEEE